MLIHSAETHFFIRKLSFIIAMLTEMSSILYLKIFSIVSNTYLTHHLLNNHENNHLHEHHNVAILGQSHRQSSFDICILL